VNPCLIPKWAEMPLSISVALDYPEAALALRWWIACRAALGEGGPWIVFIAWGRRRH